MSLPEVWRDNISDLCPGIPPDIGHLYTEAVAAFDANLDLLCATGLRMLLEQLCRHDGAVGKDENDGALYTALEVLRWNSYLPPWFIDHLRFVLRVGNQAIHEVRFPSESDLYEAFGIVTRLLAHSYSQGHTIDN